jgi:DNA primase catalytic subunit
MARWSRLNLEDYYKTAKLKLPTFPEFRYYKFRLRTGKWIFLSYINNVDQLRKYALRYKPIEIFYSTCLFQSPKNVEKVSYQLADRLFLKMPDIVFDLDGDINQVIKDARYILANMKRFKLESIHETGYKGVRLIFKDRIRKQIASIQQRIKYYTKHRQKIIEKFKKLKTLDHKVTTDYLRVIRLVGSPHRITGNICRELTKTELFTLPESRKTMTSGLGLNAEFRRYKQKGNKLAGIRLLPNYSYTCFDNVVRGCKDSFVPILTFKQVDYKLLMKSQQVYNLTNMYVFGSDGYYQVLCLTKMSKSRLLKLMKFTGSTNIRIFNKHKRVVFRHTPIMTKLGVYESAPKLIKVLKSTQEQHISQSHYRFINTNFNIVESHTLCGDSHLKEFTLNVKNKAEV